MVRPLHGMSAAGLPRCGRDASHVRQRSGRAHLFASLVPDPVAPSPNPSASLKGANTASVASSGAGSAGPTASGGSETELGLSTRSNRQSRSSLPGCGRTKERAEKEQEQLAKTLERMFARLSGPPGAGNAALAEFQQDTQRHRPAERPAAGKGMRDIRYRRRLSRVPKATRWRAATSLPLYKTLRPRKTSATRICTLS